MKDLQWLEEKENLKKKKDLKKKLKAALFTALLFVGVFGGFYILENYVKESIVVLLSIIAIASIYTIWKFIYDEME